MKTPVDPLRFSQYISALKDGVKKAITFISLCAAQGSWAGGGLDAGNPQNISGPVAICKEGVDLYFQIDSYVVRIKSTDWIITPNPVLSPSLMAHPPREFRACKSSPLIVKTLKLRGPKDREPMLQRNLMLLAPNLNKELMSEMRHDFKPVESTCQRGPHWTWCGTPTDMRLAPPGSEGMNSYVSVKFDLDFYKTPLGHPLFIGDSRLGPPLFVGSRTVFYRWDERLAIAYVPRECTGTQTTKSCDTSNYIESDNDIRQLIRKLISMQ